MNEMIEKIITRHAIRRFADRQLEEETLREILTAGLYAPSAGNNQYSRIVVCQDKAVNLKLGQLSRYMQFKGRDPGTVAHSISSDQPSIQDDFTILDGFYGAPTVLTIFTPPRPVRPRRRRDDRRKHHAGGPLPRGRFLLHRPDGGGVRDRIRAGKAERVGRPGRAGSGLQRPLGLPGRAGAPMKSPAKRTGLSGCRRRNKAPVFPPLVLLYGQNLPLSNAASPPLSRLYRPFPCRLKPVSLKKRAVFRQYRAGIKPFPPFCTFFRFFPPAKEANPDGPATCLQKLQYVGILTFATVDAAGAPQLRQISAIHFALDDPTPALYFFTARGKDFCRELLADGRVQILGYTRYKEMIRLSAKAVPVPEPEQEEWIDRIFSEQPYLANVYPGDTRKIGIVFRVSDGEVEYFNLGVRPIYTYIYSGTVPLRRRQSPPQGLRDYRTLHRLREMRPQLPPGLHHPRQTLCHPAEPLPPLRGLLRKLPGRGGGKERMR